MALAADNLNVRLPLQKKHGFEDPRSSSGVYSRTARCRHEQTKKLRDIICPACSLFVVVICLVLLLLLIIASSEPISAASIGKGDDKVSVCTSAQCKQFSESLRGTMDLLVNPCDDFFQYVCGNFNSKFNISKDSSRSFSWFHRNKEFMLTKVKNILRGNVTGYPKPVQQAKDLFDLCMDKDKVEGMYEKDVEKLVTSLISPPYTKIAQNVTGHLNLSTYRFDWLDTIIKIKSQLGLDVLISVGLKFDPKNTTVHRITIGTTTIFPSIDIEKQRHNHNNFERSDFSNNIWTAGLPEFGILDGEKQAANERKYLKLTSLHKDEYNDTIQALQDFKYKIKKISQEVTDNSQNLNTCINDESVYSVDDIQSHTDKYVESNKGTPQPIWKRYLEGVFNASDVKLDFEQDKILVPHSHLKYMEKISLLISETDPVVLELYIRSQVHSCFSDDRVDDLVKRSEQCTGIAYRIFNFALAYASIFPDDLTYLDSVKHKVLDMVDEIKHALKKIVTENQWLDLKTKQSIDEKISKLRPFIGIPEWLFKPGKLEEYYKGIEVNLNTSSIETVVNIRRAMIKKYLNRYRHPDSMSWVGDPIETNAYYVPFTNALTVEHMMTHYPFYNLGLSSLNYGSLGIVVGHELTHGFDNCGRHFDMNGNVIQSWSNESLEDFNNKTRCFVEQYSSFNASEIITKVNQNVNGKKTLDENIADNGGLRAALVALQHHLEQQGPEEKLPGFTNMTSEQLFFLSHAHTWCEAKTAAENDLRYQLQDVHPPTMFRVRATLQNSEEFAKAWKCPAGSPMNPDRERCVIF